MASGTLTGNATGDWVRLQYGKGYLLFDATAGNGFGSGTIALQIRREDSGNGVAVTTYTASPSPNPDSLDFGAPVAVRVVLTGSTSPTLYWEIGEGRTP